MKNIILASASPRRRELLKQVGISFDTAISDYDESSYEFGDDIVKDVVNIAINKVMRSRSLKSKDAIIIGADTIVELNGTVYGKPKDRTDAGIMLAALNGAVHRVITGLAALDTDTGILKTSYEITEVQFIELTSDEIDSYLDSGEYVDKAGAYAIQGTGALLVRKINGCYYNVVGLPLTNLMGLLKDMGVVF